jgi:hypothetical protein
MILEGAVVRELKAETKLQHKKKNGKYIYALIMTYFSNPQSY